MRKKIRIFIIAILLVGGTILCVVRRQAWFGMPPEPTWTGDTLPYRFLTIDDSLMPTMQKDTIHFLLLGDVHRGLDSSDYAALYKRHGHEIAFYAQLGDWIERPYKYYEQELMHAITGSGIDSIPVVATAGNHEYRKGLRRTLPDEWSKAFPQPQNGPVGNETGNYFLDFPPLRFVVINTTGLQTINDYTRINHWAKKVLNGDTVNRKHIVMMHHPVYSTAKGRQNPLIWLTFARSLNHADVVFSGHDHNYVRQTVWHPNITIWRDMHPTVYIATNASNKQYAVKHNAEYQCALSGIAVYEDVWVMNDTIRIKTLRIKDGECVDCLTIPHTAQD